MLLSFRQYAKHRGVSPEAVSKAVKMGRISTIPDGKGGRKIDPGKADIEWAQNTMRRKEEIVLPPPKKIAVGKSTPAKEGGELGNAAPAVAPPSPPPAQASARPSYIEARGVRETFAAQNEKLKFEELSGQLCRVSEVRADAFKAGRMIRDNMMSLPDRLAQQLAAEQDAHKVHALLLEEIRKILKSGSEWRPAAERKDATG